MRSRTSPCQESVDCVDGLYVSVADLPPLGVKIDLASRVWFKGRLSNRPRLVEQLGLSGDASVSVVLQAAYQRWKESCLAHIRGRFSFVILNFSQGIVFGARDPSGSEPLFYSTDSKGIRVAQSVSELMDAEKGLGNLDEERVALWLKSGTYQRNKTFQTDILRLPPGHTLNYDGVKARISRYWLPEHLPTFSSRNPESIWENYTDILRHAVQQSLPAVGAVGSHASGGIDSSAIFSWAEQSTAVSPSISLTGFSWHPPPPNTLENKHGEYSLLKSLASISSRPIIPCPIQIHTLLEVLKQDITRKPWMLANIMMTERSVQLEAKSRGINTMLTGWGGDEIASQSYGQSYRRESLRRGQLGTYARCLPFPFHLLTPLRDICYALGKRPKKRNRGNNEPSLLHPDWLQHINRKPQSLDSERQSITHPLPLLLWDRGPLANRIEALHESGREFNIRYEHPLLVQEVMEYALRIPLSLAVHPSIRRLPFRKAISLNVPEEITWAKTKLEPIRVQMMNDVVRSTLVQVGAELRARTTQPARAGFFNMPQLTEQLEPATLANRQDLKPLVKAVSVLDF